MKLSKEDLDLLLKHWEKPKRQYTVNLSLDPDDQYSKDMLKFIDQQIIKTINAHHND